MGDEKTIKNNKNIQNNNALNSQKFSSKNTIIKPNVLKLIVPHLQPFNALKIKNVDFSSQKTVLFDSGRASARTRLRPGRHPRLPNDASRTHFIKKMFVD